MSDPTPPPPPPPQKADDQGHKPNTGTRPPVTPVKKIDPILNRAAAINKAIEDAGG